MSRESKFLINSAVLGLYLIILAMALGYAFHVFPLSATPTPCTAIGSIGGCKPSNLMATLKAMPTYTPEIPTPGPTPTPCGGLCVTPEPGHGPGPSPLKPEVGPKTIEPGHLRPVGPGYPFDVHA
jgi:hypothetical protein